MIINYSIKIDGVIKLKGWRILGSNVYIPALVGLANHPDRFCLIPCVCEFWSLIFLLLFFLDFTWIYFDQNLQEKQNAKRNSTLCACVSFGQIFGTKFWIKLKKKFFFVVFLGTYSTARDLVSLNDYWSKWSRRVLNRIDLS